MSADWSISRLQSWTYSSLSTVAEFVKLTQSIVTEIQRQSADLYKVQLCNQKFFVVSTAIYVVKVYECHPLDNTAKHTATFSYTSVNELGKKSNQPNGNCYVHVINVLLTNIFNGQKAIDTRYVK